MYLENMSAVQKKKKEKKESRGRGDAVKIAHRLRVQNEASQNLCGLHLHLSFPTLHPGPDSDTFVMTNHREVIINIFIDYVDGHIR